MPLSFIEKGLISVNDVSWGLVGDDFYLFVLTHLRSPSLKYLILNPKL